LLHNFTNQYLKNIALLGSTGSIGRQALEVVKANPQQFTVIALTAHNNAQKLIEQAIEFRPHAVVIGCRDSYNLVKSALQPFDISVYTGNDALNDIVELEQIDTVLLALVGFAGLKPAINAIKAGKDLALANKESLVVAGEIISKLSKEKGASLLPIDSEHSAIFQCLVGEQINSIEKIYLTASGGPFFGKSIEFLKNVTVSQALQHPRWKMGKKITIDSASLMNKGLEVIEASWLFDLEPHQIDVLIHPESVVHSMVQFVDGNIKAQFGPTDMRYPIHFALSYPNRISSPFPRLDFDKNSNLTFFKPDKKSFRNLDLAYHALLEGGNMPCILNAANEASVELFLNNKISFLQISDIIEQSIAKIDYIRQPGLEDLIHTDKLTRSFVNSIFMSNLNKTNTFKNNHLMIRKRKEPKTG